MALVSELFEQRWRFGGGRGTTPPAHVGEAKPILKVQLRRGHLERDYAPWSGDDVGAIIPGSSKHKPWQATWTPSEDYQDLPGVLEVDLQQDFQNNGQARATITVENVQMVEQSGVAGIFRTIEKGYLSPWRGYSDGSKRLAESVGAKNAWYEKLNRNVQITVWAGYGEDTLVPMWTGLVDDLDMTSKPARIVVTARDFGQLLTDQRVFGRVRGPFGPHEPVVFADRHKADNVERVGGAVQASGAEPGHPARLVLDGKDSTAWISDAHDDPDHTEWVEIHVPHGRYESFLLDSAFAGMEMFVSVYVRNRDVRNKSNFEGMANPAKMEGQPIGNGWLDTGLGNVPGTDTPYIKHVKATESKWHYYTLPRLEIGTDSVIRLHFRKLRKWRRDKRYHAGVHTFKAIRRTLKPEARKNKWVMVDDLTDVAKVLFRWAGFKEWDVETAGVRLKENLVVNRTSTLQDVVNQITAQTGYVFYMSDPTLADSSIGVPVLRSNSVFGRVNNTRIVRDTDLLTGAQVKLTEDPLVWPIIVKGALAKKSHGGTVAVGRTSFFGEPSSYGGKYYPPWYQRMAGVIKHAIHYDRLLKSTLECKMACYLIALGAAMKSVTCVIEFPANPGIELDEQLAFKDTATGFSTRIYVAARGINFRTGQNASFKMTVGGSLIDTPDVQGVLHDMNQENWRGSESADNVPHSIAHGSGSREELPDPVANGGHVQQP